MKRILKMIALVLAFVLVAGSISSLFDPEPSGKITLKPPDDETEVFGGRYFNNLTFDEKIAYSNGSFNQGEALPGYSLAGVKIGSVHTNNDRLNLTTTESDVIYSEELKANGNYRDSFIALYFLNKTKQIKLSSIDYFSFDIDISSTYFPEKMSFIIASRNSDSKASLFSKSYIAITSNSVIHSTIDSASTVYENKYGDDIHLTFVGKIDHSNVEKSTANVYCNGELIYEGLNIFSSDAVLLDYLRIYFPNDFANDIRTVTFDNFQVCGFGNGDGTYSGTITELFEDNTKKLTDCSDSVLFNK